MKFTYKLKCFCILQAKNEEKSFISNRSPNNKKLEKYFTMPEAERSREKQKQKKL